MSKYGTTDNTATTSDSDVVSSYDQSFSLSVDGVALPIVRGERRVAGQHVISGFYGRTTKKVKSSSSGKK